MAIQRNGRLMNYLMLGSVGIISMLLGACNKTTHDYRADSDRVYVNNSSYELNIVLGHGEYDGTKENFILPVNASYTVELRSFATTDKLQATDFRSPYQYHGATIAIESQRYVMEPDDGLANALNYRHLKLGTNYFQFTYVFTDEAIKNMMNAETWE